MAPNTSKAVSQLVLDDSTFLRKHTKTKMVAPIRRGVSLAKDDANPGAGESSVVRPKIPVVSPPSAEEIPLFFPEGRTRESRISNPKDERPRTELQNRARKLNEAMTIANLPYRVRRTIEKAAKTTEKPQSVKPATSAQSGADIPKRRTVKRQIPAEESPSSKRVRR